PRSLPPFPTRRSSDLGGNALPPRAIPLPRIAARREARLVANASATPAEHHDALATTVVGHRMMTKPAWPGRGIGHPPTRAIPGRSEEHTSELQSQSNL